MRYLVLLYLILQLSWLVSCTSDPIAPAQQVPEGCQWIPEDRIYFCVNVR